MKPVIAVWQTFLGLTSKILWTALSVTKPWQRLVRYVWSRFVQGSQRKCNFWPPLQILIASDKQPALLIVSLLAVTRILETSEPTILLWRKDDELNMSGDIIYGIYLGSALDQDGWCITYRTLSLWTSQSQ